MTFGPSDLEEYRRALATLTLPRFAARAPGGPFVLALEGPNGVGKTTLCRAMTEKLGAASCLGTDEAWFSKEFKTRMIRDASWHSSAMFFLSGCFEQMRLLRQRTEPLMIMDRCLWSTFAVHAAQSAQRLEMLIAMVRPVATEIAIPHLTLVLEASFGACQERISGKDSEARELDQLTGNEAFHQREQEFYRWLSGQTPNVEFLDVDQDKPQEVARKAIAAFRLHRC